MQSFILGGETFRCNVQRGKVVHIDSNSETHVSSHTNNAGYIQSIGSSVLNRQDFYMEDGSGKQFVVNLTNWDIKALKDHEMLFIWLENRHKSNYAIVYNKSLDMTVRNGFFHEYFDVTSDNIGCLKLLAGFIALIGLPTIVYGASRNDTATFMTFLAMLALLVLIFFRHGRQKDRQEKSSRALSIKMENILQSGLKDFK